MQEEIEVFYGYEHSLALYVCFVTCQKLNYCKSFYILSTSVNIKLGAVKILCAPLVSVVVIT